MPIQSAGNSRSGIEAKVSIGDSIKISYLGRKRTVEVIGFVHEVTKHYLIIANYNPYHATPTFLNRIKRRYNRSNIFVQE